MLLQDERCPNTKFMVAGKEVSTDAKGVIEISDKNAAASFIASGFKECLVKVKVKNEKPGKSAEEKFARAEGERNAAEDAKAEEAKPVEAAREKPRWSRGNK